MGFIVKRKTFDIGYSRAVTLPKSWIDYHGKDNTDELTIMGDDILVIAPRGYERRAEAVMRALASNNVNLLENAEEVEKVAVTARPGEDDTARTPNELATLLGVPPIRVREILRIKYNKPPGSQQWGLLTSEQQGTVVDLLRRQGRA